MTNQSGGNANGLPVGGVLAGSLPNPSFAAGQIPRELGYASATAPQGIAATTVTDVTSLSVTVTVGMYPLVIEADIPACHANVGSSAAQLRIIDVTASNATLQLVVQDIDAAAGRLYARIRVAPAAGSRQYKVQVYGTTAFTLDSTATSIASLHVREV